jgi:serine/threonine protein kinase/tetratricopeptide (TPR) repeat protein
MEDSPLIGRTLGHYRIVAKIGAGGMGEVYRARDERLERDVALKVLPVEALSDEAARKRFRKEALALSKLNHAHIATIYDFDSDSGMDFLAMEYVVGESLGQKIANKSLSEKDLAGRGSQIADALEEAHEHGIVHRDLKPGNVMVTQKGRVKVLDFGLAKLLRPGGPMTAADTLSETHHGMSGTMPYMAPEQLREETVDQRSDIFGLGTVLYEMAVGQRPFPETSAVRLTDSILHHAPVPPRALNSRVSPELERIILKCLEKAPELRFQSAKELSVDLRRLSAQGVAAVPANASRGRSRVRLVAAASMIALLTVLAVVVLLYTGVWRDRLPGNPKTPKFESLAVLPLANLSADPAQEYFADGMTEELTTELSQISGLRVISRTSTMRYKGSQKPLPEIAKELGVDAVIEGSVERSGDEVRISAQLINARSDTHLWARSYHRNLRDVLAMQSEVARAIAGEISVQLTPQEQARFERSRPVNVAAYEAYLRGLYHWNFHTPDEMQKAIVQYNRAIEIDPSYALAYVALSNTYHLLPFNADAPPQEAFPKAKEAALKAIQLDPQLGEAHSSLGLVLGQYDWDWTEAEREHKRAIELNANSPSALMYYAELLSLRGHNDQAIATATRGRELDPVSGAVGLQLSRAYFHARQYDRAAQSFRQFLETNPHFWPLHLFLGQVYEQQGQYAKALAELHQAEGPTLQARSVIGHVYARSGQRPEAEKILGELIARSNAAYLPPTYIARIYAGLGQKDEAIAWLEKGYALRDSHLEFLGVDPTFDELRSDTRFTDLLHRLKLTQ